MEDTGIVVYADDNTPITCHYNPNTLQINIQEMANQATTWITDNKLSCSGEKTKLLVMGTATNRNIKLESVNKKLSVMVCGETVEEVSAENLLGIVINNTCTWKNHMHGYNDGVKDKPGLIKQLSRRVGLLSRLNRYLRPRQFSMVMNGLFNSKLIYGISVWGGVWNIPGILNDVDRSSPSLTKEDNRQLQTLQNKVMRMQTRLPKETPTVHLLQASGQLSVQQLTAYHSLLQVYKAKMFKQPEYIYSRLFPNGNIVDEEARVSRSLRNNLIRIDVDLAITRNAFFYRSSRLWNAIPMDIRNSVSIKSFKVGVKKWIRENIYHK